MKTRFSLLSVLGAVAALAAMLLPGARPAYAQTTLSTEHLDLTFNYVSPNWSLTVQDKTNGIDYAPSAAILNVKSAAKKTRPTGTQWDFLGVAAGQPIWVLPFSRNVNLLYLGTNVEGTPTGTFDAYDATTESGGRQPGVAPWVKVRLVSVSGPEAFSVWTQGAFGATTVWMASSNGVAADDDLWIYEGSHIHFNWGFSKAGTYTVVLQSSGYVGGVLLTSPQKTYTFTVQP